MTETECPDCKTKFECLNSLLCWCNHLRFRGELVAGDFYLDKDGRCKCPECLELIH